MLPSFSYVVVTGFLLALGMVLLWKMVQGEINVSGLLASGPGGRGGLGRLQLLLATILGATWYVGLIFDQARVPSSDYSLPPVPEGLLLLIGASNGGYILTKLQSFGLIKFGN